MSSATTNQGSCPFTAQTKLSPEDSEKNWDQYSDYLGLDKVLNAQAPRSLSQQSGQSSQADKAASHDEMLFIIFHQVYELWFKQILFEFDDIQARFSSPIVNDRDLGPVINQLERVVLIMKGIVTQLDILETMNPQSFVDFRRYLESASGFQSWQFRLVEIRLGLKREDRLAFNYHDYDRDMNDTHRGYFETAENAPTLYTQLETWLERTPFLENEKSHYTFWTAYRDAVTKMFDAQDTEVANSHLSDDDKQVESAAIARGRQKFESLFDEASHKEMVEKGVWRMSWRALQSALFISIYRDQPVLQMPFKLLSLLMDIDALLAKWRYAHALMVQRMVGMSGGTGGSAGYGYLMQTLEKHRIYNDLFALSSYLIPSDAMPELPEAIKQNMGYRYS